MAVGRGAAGYGAGQLELWVDGIRISTAVPSATSEVNFVQAGVLISCHVGHVQLYAGADAYTFEQHLAQLEVAREALECQRVD